MQSSGVGKAVLRHREDHLLKTRLSFLCPCRWAQVSALATRREEERLPPPRRIPPFSSELRRGGESSEEWLEDYSAEGESDSTGEAHTAARDAGRLRSQGEGGERGVGGVRGERRGWKGVRGGGVVERQAIARAYSNRVREQALSKAHAQRAQHFAMQAQHHAMQASPKPYDHPPNTTTTSTTINTNIDTNTTNNNTATNKCLPACLPPTSLPVVPSPLNCLPSYLSSSSSQSPQPSSVHLLSLCLPGIPHHLYHPLPVSTHIPFPPCSDSPPHPPKHSSPRTLECQAQLEQAREQRDQQAHAATATATSIANNATHAATAAVAAATARAAAAASAAKAAEERAQRMVEEVEEAQRERERSMAECNKLKVSLCEAKRQLTQARGRRGGVGGASRI